MEFFLAIELIHYFEFTQTRVNLQLISTMHHTKRAKTMKPAIPYPSKSFKMKGHVLVTTLVMALVSCGGGGGGGANSSTSTSTSPTTGSSTSTSPSTGAGSSSGSASSGSSTSTPSTSSPIDYPHSLVVGNSAFQGLVLTPMVSAPAVLTAPNASQLLKAGSNLVLTQYTNANLPGLAVACISGVGNTNTIISDINLGDYSQSAALMMSANWNAIDPVAAWGKASASGTGWQGWEDCGIKPEGPPTPASTLVPNAQGGYSEAIYDGNPGTTFNVLALNYSPAQVASMLSPSGLVSTVNPKRSLLLTLRAYADNAGHQVWVEMGYPLTPSDPTQGFISLYVQ